MFNLNFELDVYNTFHWQLEGSSRAPPPPSILPFCSCLTADALREIAMTILNAGYEFSLLRARVQLGDTLIDVGAPLPGLLIVGSITAYVLLLALALQTTWWRARARALARAHHAALCVYSAVVCALVAAHLVRSGEAAEFAAWLAAPARAPAPRLVCAPVPAWLRVVSLSFTLSKLWEWLDTAVLIAEGKSLGKIGFLHLYHHATTFGLFSVVSSFPVTEKLGLLLNGGVHTLMYYHFAFRLPKAARPLITLTQIVQLAVVTYAWIYCSSACDEYKAYRSASAASWAFPFALVPVYLVLFVKFFVETFLCRAAKASGSKGE